jgi:predicted transcriptional regulator
MTDGTRPDVSDAELAVLQFLWQQGSTPVRQIVEALYPRGNPSDFATVQKLLERLEAKGFARRDRSSRPHRFEAAIARDDLIDLRLRTMADKICGGSLAPLLTHLVSGRLSSAERQSLRTLLDELDRPG